MTSLKLKRTPAGMGSGPALILLAFMVALAAAGPVRAETPARVRALVSIPPQAYFLHKLGGDLVSITIMVPPGADAHTYEPKPRQMAELTRADVYFAVGVEFERAWLAKFRAANPGMKVIHTEAEVPRVAMVGRNEDEDHGSDHDHDNGQGAGHHHDQAEDHHGLDPHIWLSPRLAVIQAKAMAEGLALVDPAHRADYTANLTALLKQIKALDATLSRALAKLGHKRRVLVYHPAWGYFCRDYGLEMIAIEKEGKKPTARGLAHLIEQARREGAGVVFVQPQFSSRAAQTVARAIHGRVVALDPLAADWAANLNRVARELEKAAY